MAHRISDYPRLSELPLSSWLPAGSDLAEIKLRFQPGEPLENHGTTSGVEVTRIKEGAFLSRNYSYNEEQRSYDKDDGEVETEAVTTFEQNYTLVVTRPELFEIGYEDLPESSVMTFLLAGRVRKHLVRVMTERWTVVYVPNLDSVPRVPKLLSLQGEHLCLSHQAKYYEDQMCLVEYRLQRLYHWDEPFVREVLFVVGKE